MRHLSIAEPNDQSWKRWRKRCEKKKAEVIKAAADGIIPEVSELYMRQKAAYMALFKGKCAYCEESVRNHRGELDHYRPKGRVRDEHGVLVTKEIDGVEIGHPGYYWLAYDWTNLLLACTACNQRMGEWGKYDHFPVDGEHAWLPGGEADEKALLINPVCDDPCEHLFFDVSSGLFEPRAGSKRGEVTIKILGLNRPDLARARLEAFKNAQARFNETFGERRLRGPDAVNSDLRNMHDNEEGDFTSVTRLAIKQAAQEVVASVDGLPA